MSSGSAPNPFSLSIDPRDRLLLFDIADDAVYAAMELQVFDDEVHGQGMLVLLQHHDGLVDFYRQPTLNLDKGKFSIGRGVGRWRKARIKPDVLNIADDGVEVNVALRDAEGRRIEVQLDDRDGVSRRRSTLLAPVGAGVEQPYSFFVVLMRGFDLLRTSGAQPRLSIGGEERHIASFPGPEWVHRRRFARYSAEPIIAELNPRHDGPLTDRGTVDGIITLTSGWGVRSATLRFEPTFPNLRSLAPGDEAAGRWTLDVADQPALTGGTWQVERDGDEAQLSMHVTQPWRPRDLPPSLKMVTTVARVFRQWPTTYRWAATVDLGTEPARMTSAWSRTEPVEWTNAYRLPRPRRRGVAAALAIAGVGLAALIRRRREP
jgi:hypothetical protein